MRKAICLLISLLLCLSVTLPAMADETSFVPSIAYKDSPAIEEASMGGQDVEGCVVVTNIARAKDKSTDISQEDRDLLLEVYEKLEEGTMTLPLEGTYVVRELVDVSFEYEDCRQIEEHGNKGEKLKQEGVDLTVTFDLDVAAIDEVIVLAYVDGEWTQVENVKNNGNGTVTCVFEDLCPVAFVMGSDASTGNSAAGNSFGSRLVFVMGIMMLIAVCVVALRNIKARKHH